MEDLKLPYFAEYLRQGLYFTLATAARTGSLTQNSPLQKSVHLFRKGLFSIRAWVQVFGRAILHLQIADVPVNQQLNSGNSFARSYPENFSRS
jgi:hypothetical protein